MFTCHQLVTIDYVQVWMPSVQSIRSQCQNLSNKPVLLSLSVDLNNCLTFSSLASNFNEWAWLTEPRSHTCTLAARKSACEGAWMEAGDAIY